GQGGRSNPDEARLYRRDTVFDDGASIATPRYARTKLLADDRVIGPAIVVQHNSTTIVPPGFAAHVLSHGDIRVGRTDKGDAR
ncbi:MAG: hydantoinase/oxoprolinase family protein, partial [Pseudomonadota bacterium]|nr:hydantoinase/oxoprolinase family protein [Pseudomonadota bacterium]